jgi:molybdenum cofactor cytidylyltransferase
MICAIVLAAGRSRRMGSQKLLLPFAESTVVGHVVGQIVASDVDQVYVIVGRDAAAIAEALRDRPVRIVRNPDPDGDMLSSVRCGLRAVPPDCRAVLVALGDQPGITGELVNCIINAYLSSDRKIAVPVHKGQRGHPLLLSVECRDEVLRDYEHVGLQGLLRQHPEDVLEVPVSSPAAVSDMDCPADYRRELAHLRSVDWEQALRSESSRDRAPPSGGRPRRR